MGSRFLLGILRLEDGLGLVPGFAVAVVIQLVFADFAAESVAVDS